MGNLATIPEEELTWDSYYRIYYDNDDDEFVEQENPNTIYTTPMAEGGYDPTNEKDPLLPKTGDDDDDDAGNENQSIDWNTTDISQVPAPKY